MDGIKLLACITFDELQEALLRTTSTIPDWLEGYTSHDMQVGIVREFFESKNLPWSEQFVSIFVLLPEDEPESLHHAFGYGFELDIDAVLPQLEVVCSDDIHNCAVNRKNPTFSANLKQLKPEQKLNALRAAREASIQNAPKPVWVDLFVLAI